MSSIRFLTGIGFQELLLLLIVLFGTVVIPVAFVFVIIKMIRKRASNLVTSPKSDDLQTPILENAGKLRELNSLQDKRIISHDEFEIEKRKILGMNS